MVAAVLGEGLSQIQAAWTKLVRKMYGSSLQIDTLMQMVITCYR